MAICYPDDDEDISTKERFLSVFKLQECDGDEAMGDNSSEEEEEENSGQERYLANVRSKLQFYSCIKMVSNGLSFRQVSNVMEDMKETLRLATLRSMSPQKVSSYVRIACASNLQTIAAILKESWAFSIALDGGNKSDTSYLDVRIRVVSSRGVLLNLHLLAIPMRERHTGEHMFELVSTALDNLAPDWKTQIISVTSDGASSMTGQYRGVASRIANVALPGFYRVWCALHQLDLVLQRLYNSLCDDSYVGTVTSLTGHLRRQFNLIQEMGSKCPKFVCTRWMSMSKVVKWFVAHRLPVAAHLATRNVTWMPTDQWWIITCCLNRVMKIVDVAIVVLQGQQLQVSTQRQILAGLIVDLCQLADGKILGPLTPHAIAELHMNDEVQHAGAPIVAEPPPLAPQEAQPAAAEGGAVATDPLVDEPGAAEMVRNVHVSKGKYAMRLDAAHSFIENCGCFVTERLLVLEGAGDLFGYNQVLKSVAHMFVDLINGVESIQAERDAANDSSDFLLPPVTPKQLFDTTNRDFSKLIQQQRHRLAHTFDGWDVDALEEQFNDMKGLLGQNARIKALVENEKPTTPFAEAWAPFDDNKFGLLKRFFGGLASVFPGTATVESNFLLINWEENEYCACLTDFSLKGILHSKQYFELLEVAHKMQLDQEEQEG